MGLSNKLLVSLVLVYVTCRESAAVNLFKIKHDESGLCVGIQARRSFRTPVMWPCANGPGQTWYWEGRKIRSGWEPKTVWMAKTWNYQVGGLGQIIGSSSQPYIDQSFYYENGFLKMVYAPHGDDIRVAPYYSPWYTHNLIFKAKKGGLIGAQQYKGRDDARFKWTLIPVEK